MVFPGNEGKRHWSSGRISSARSVDVGNVIHLLIDGNRWQPFRHGGPLQLNRDGLFRIALMVCVVGHPRDR